MTTSLNPAPTVDPYDPFVPHPARIQAIVAEVASIDTYALEFEDADTRRKYRFQPGQFNMLYLPGIGEAAISISSDPNQPESLLHTVRAVGNVTTALTHRKPGDQILLRGPFGSSWPLDECRGCDLVIAAGGVGLPPLRPAIYEIMQHRDQFGRVMLLYGARTPSDLLFQDEYDAWQRAGIEVEITVDIGDVGWSGHIGVVPALFERLTLDPARTRLFTCGPEIMMRFVIYEALERGVESHQTYLSIERNMNCAVGFCGHCQLGPTFVCKDGPVFNFEQIDEYLGVEDF